MNRELPKTYPPNSETKNQTTQNLSEAAVKMQQKSKKNVPIRKHPSIEKSLKVSALLNDNKLQQIKHEKKANALIFSAKTKIHQNASLVSKIEKDVLPFCVNPIPQNSQEQELTFNLYPLSINYNATFDEKLKFGENISDFVIGKKDKSVTESNSVDQDGPSHKRQYQHPSCSIVSSVEKNPKNTSMRSSSILKTTSELVNTVMDEVQINLQKVLVNLKDMDTTLSSKNRSRSLKNRSQSLNRVLQKQRDLKLKQENDETQEVRIEEMLKNQLKTSFNQNDKKRFNDLEKVEEISELNFPEIEINKPKLPLVGRIASYQKFIYDKDDGNRVGGLDLYRGFSRNFKPKLRKEAIKIENNDTEFKYKCFVYGEKGKKTKSLKKLNLLSEKSKEGVSLKHQINRKNELKSKPTIAGKNEKESSCDKVKSKLVLKNDFSCERNKAKKLLKNEPNFSCDKTKNILAFRYEANDERIRQKLMFKKDKEKSCEGFKKCQMGTIDRSEPSS